MFETELQGEVLTANTEQQLHIPSRTRNIRFSTPSAFPIRVSLNPGEVTGNNLGGFLVSSVEAEDTGEIGRFDGPIYYASEQPHAILDVVCLASKV